MELVSEKQTQLSSAELEAQQHNAMIKERYRRLQNAVADQFAAVENAVHAETPVKEEKSKKKEKVNKKQEELEKALAEAEENKRKWYAVTAEYENYRRRTQNQAAQRYQEGRNDVIASLFPVGDNLERALQSCADENTKQGLQMVLAAFKKVLEGEGVEEVDPVGQPFNADTMEAIMAVPAAEGEESGIVKQAYVKGYKKGEKVLRYAQVIVTQ
jgi:molecular chaperone GrpE